MTGQHALLAPSSAHRWIGCHGSPAMERRYPEDSESEASREGTAAHFVLAEMLARRPVTIGQLAPNGYPVNAEMVEAVEPLIRDISETYAAASTGASSTMLVFHVEQRVSAHKSVHVDNWGTPDVYLLDPLARALHIWDFKYGHKYVDAFENWQMIDYACCILESNGYEWNAPTADPRSWGNWRINVTVAQPRNYHIEGPMRGWYLSGGSLVDRYRPRLAEAARAAVQPGASLTTGEHCDDCRAAHACPALQRAAMAGVDRAYRQSPVDMDPASIGLELKILDASIDRMKARRDAKEAEAAGLIKAGTPVPHWAMGSTKPRERWKQDAATVIGLGRAMGYQLTAPLAAVTPAQARKSGATPEFLAMFAETPPGAPKLIPFESADAARVFGER